MESLCSKLYWGTYENRYGGKATVDRLPDSVGYDSLKNHQWISLYDNNTVPFRIVSGEVIGQFLLTIDSLSTTSLLIIVSWYKISWYGDITMEMEVHHSWEDSKVLET